MQKYTHEDVPEEIAKKFPALQGKQFITKDQVPSHVLESVQKNAQPKQQLKHSYISTMVPTNTHQFAGSSFLQPPVFHHSATPPHIGAIQNTTAKTTTTQTNEAHNNINVTTSPSVKPVVHHQTHKSHGVHHQVSGHHGKVFGHSSKVFGGSVAQKGAYTHENVPEDILKRFPTLQNKQIAATSRSTVKVNGNYTTIKSPEKIDNPQINIINSSETQQ